MAYTSSYSGAQSDAYITQTQLVDLVYPVGSIYMSLNDINPSTFLGGTWEQIPGRFLLAQGSATGFSAGIKGGSEQASLTDVNLPKHTHIIFSFAATKENDTPTELTLQSDGNLVTYKATDSSGNRAWTFQSATSGATVNSTNEFRWWRTGFEQNLKETGNGTTTSHENMPPYFSVYMWKRTA